MRNLHLVLPLLMLIGCGGMSRQSAAGNVSGSAGAPSGGESQAGGASGKSSSSAGGGNGGAAPGGGASGESSGGADTSSGGTLQGGDAGAMSGGAGAPSGDAGQSASADCVALGCLAGAELVYRPTRQWQSSAVQGAADSIQLSEADYTPRVGDPLTLKFSSDATQLTMTPSTGGQPVLGTRDPKRTDQAWYNLNLFAGGRFVVQASGATLQAEHTVYGSGSPIVSSTRGMLEGP